jgi:restriction system protein
VATQKRRKPAGLTGAIADAVNQERAAREQTRKLELQATLARAKADAKTSAAAARETLRQDKQTARENELAAGRAEAETVTRTLQARLDELENLLRSTLEEDPYLSFEQLKQPLDPLAFDPPADLVATEPPPRADEFLPEPLTGLAARAPGRKRAYAAALEDGRASFNSAAARHADAEQARQDRLARARADHDELTAREQLRVQRQHDLVDQRAAEFAAGKRKAVAEYFYDVLAEQRYPSDFPTGLKVAYLPAGRQLVADIDLPLLDAIPDLILCEYQPTRKVLKYAKMREPARNVLYQNVIAQMALRTIRSLFLADRGGIVEKFACNGYIDTINSATGQPAHWCLVTVEVERVEFEGLDLARVDPLDCLAHLHAKVSRTPEKCTPVQPILDYPWDDLPFSDEADAAAGLDTVQNLLDLDGYEFERLMVQLCEAMPYFDEVRRTRSRGDGGIDLVAVNKTPFSGGRVAVQAKRYASHRKVDVAAVREMVGSISQREFNKGIIITTSDFTRAAREEASRLGIELYNHERLLWLLLHYLHREFTIIDQARRIPRFNSPP